MKQASDILQLKVDEGTLSEMPPVPSREWLCLQFVPNCSDNAIAANFVGHLEAKRPVQMRSQRKQNIDQHWNNTMTRYHLEWIVQLRRVFPLC